jgi:hypothetical protein
MSHHCPSTTIALRNICLPVLTIGLGEAAAEMIYALSSIHLGLCGTSINRDSDNRDCTVVQKLIRGMDRCVPHIHRIPGLYYVIL